MADLIPIVPVEGDSVPLADGRTLTLKAITPAAKPVLAAAIRRLSLESSRLRFFTPRRELSDLELERLTAMDGWHRYALGLCRPAADGGTEGIGVARYARLADDPRAAEIAVTVIDDYQGQGLGKALLARLFAAAAMRGIERLQAIVLPDNTPMLGLFRKYAPAARWRHGGDHLTVDIPLAAAAMRVPAAA
jgi:GNAT superfamily N-acetyltransferase